MAAAIRHSGVRALPSITSGATPIRTHTCAFENGRLAEKKWYGREQ